MSGIRDYDDDDDVTRINHSMGIDSEGDVMIRVGNNMGYDPISDEFHFTSNWNSDDDDD